MTDNITIVTAFFDLGRGDLPAMKHGRILPHHQHRSTETYFEFFKNLAMINNPMVIFTSPDLVDRIRNIRIAAGHGDKTEVVGMVSYLPPHLEHYKDKIEKVMNDPDFIKNVVNPQLIEYWHSDYVLVNILKSYFVNYAVESGSIKTDLAAWIDFGYVRTIEALPKNLTWRYPFDPEKIHLFNMRDLSGNLNRTLADIVYTGDVYIQGCHIVGGVEAWNKLYQLMFINLDLALHMNLSDDDQTFLMMSYLSAPKYFELHYNSPNDWFRIFKDYNNA